MSSTFQLLRFHFSLFLLPVYLFALSEVAVIDWGRAAMVFVILHLLVYPSSNGYNSYMDRDTTPIGGLAKPMQPTRQLYYVTLIMDLLALALSILVSFGFQLGILIYILASRAYSSRSIRLKKYPIPGFLTIFIFQGAWVFMTVWHGLTGLRTWEAIWLPALISSLLIGALYPLTQIYQHEADRKDGVITISMLVGKRGTFIFSALFFVTATILFWLRFREERMNHFSFFLLIMLPVVCFFLYWMIRVWKNEQEASFINSLRMNVLATLCTTVFFITLIVWNH